MNSTEQAEKELGALRAELQELLLSMELHHERDSEEAFLQWWQQEGNEQRYFRKKRELEQKEETIRKLRQLEEMDLRMFYEEMRTGKETSGGTAGRRIRT